MDDYNGEHEMNTRIEWTLTTAMQRLNMNRPGRPGGKQPTWKFTAAHGAVTRTGKAGGIDAIRYRREVLVPKLIPFAKKCSPDFMVQEDKAPAHASHFQKSLVYDAHHVLRLLWPGNSPDLNMIEPCWMWMKMETTKQGVPGTRKEAEAAWKKCWKDMSQERIQRWILRIVRHIQTVILLEGDNKYQERPFGEGEVAGETGEWVDLGALDLHLPETI
jgi:DDE superfamily endonuclease